MLLPNCGEDSCPARCDKSYRYVDCCIMGMVERFAGMGVVRSELVIKVFGGSDILVVDGQENHASVGKQNIAAARKTLQREGLRVSSSHVGGTLGRKIFFFTDTGVVFMKRIRKNMLSREEA